MFVFTKQSIYLDNAVSAFRVAVTCQSASASMRFTAAQLWTLLAHNMGHDTALEAYQHAIELLPRLAVLSLDLQARQQVLASGIEGLARRAAACAIQCGLPDKAAGFLEDGRNVFWSQALQLRTPLDKVNRVAPELARKLENISRALEQGAFRDVAQGCQLLNSGSRWNKRLPTTVASITTGQQWSKKFESWMDSRIFYVLIHRPH
jgi:hypothetical protein